jgi:hypothetical protein
MDPVFTSDRKCIQNKNRGGEAPGLWCKQVVYIVKTPLRRDIAPDNTVLSGAISTSAADTMGWGPP